MKSLPILLGLAVASLGAPAAAQNTYVVPMDGVQMETGSPGVGLVTITLDTATGTVTAEGTYSGLMGDLLGVHIHGPAEPFEHAPVKIPLTFEGTTSGTIGGGGQHATPVGMEDMLCGLYYLVLHTSAIGGGELRGQILAPSAATPFGSGVNPANSLSLLSGTPAIPSTFSFGIDNPTGSQPAPGLGLVFLSTAVDPLFALTGTGSALPGFGMAGPVGELLISALSPDPFLTLSANGWSGPGSPLPIDLALPDNKNLIGLTLYAQGALFAGGQFGLTNGLELYLGT